MCDMMMMMMMMMIIILIIIVIFVYIYSGVERHVFKNSGETITVQCVGLLPLLQHIFKTKPVEIIVIDLLVVDIQAGELELLKAIDWEHVLIQAIIIETAKKKNHLDIRLYLSGHGYLLKYQGIKDDFYMLHKDKLVVLQK